MWVTWLSVTICDNLWHLWLSVADICDYLWLSVTICDYLWQIVRWQSVTICDRYLSQISVTKASHTVTICDRYLSQISVTKAICATDGGHRTSNNYECQISNVFSRESPYISNTFSRESPNDFGTSFHVCKRSPRHSKDLTRKSLNR